MKIMAILLVGLVKLNWKKVLFFLYQFMDYFGFCGKILFSVVKSLVLPLVTREIGMAGWAELSNPTR
jgi:hypothetical protein